jgi:two-component sensor histidine kinase
MVDIGNINSAVTQDPLVLARPALDAVAAAVAPGHHQVRVDCEPDLRLPEAVVENLQLVAHEAVDNALRHAFPNHIEGHVWIRLFYDRGRLTLTIRDDGIGMPDFADYESGGRARIVQAANALHAYARMGAAPFGGALVSITLPA